MACEITTLEVNGWDVEYQGCNSSQIGNISLSHLDCQVNENDGKTYHRIKYEGTNTNGDAILQKPWIPAEEIEDLPSGEDYGNAANINPTKVFNWIVKKAKGYLCPQCT